MAIAMPRVNRRTLVVGAGVVLMLATSGGTQLVKRSLSRSVQQRSLDLEDMIPNAFADWRQVDSTFSRIVDPVLEGTVSSIYSATLSRVYARSDGKRIMLSIAFSSSQTRETQVHRPEVCYVAQGFEVSELSKSTARVLRSGELPVMRLVARAGTRTEPVTYWLRIGDNVVRGNIEQGLARVSHGLRGEVPDGLVFRVSSLDTRSLQAFQGHDEFVEALLSAVPASTQRELIGQFADVARTLG